MSRSLRLYVPNLPVPLAEQFIRDRYRRILGRRDWSALRREAEFQLNASKEDGTVSYTRGDTTIAGTSTSFVSTDVGRQFKVGVGSPIYTITAVDDTLQILTLDRAIGVATATAATYKIFDGYVTPPTDFLRFLLVVDPLQGWRLRHWITAQEIMSWDPQRNFFGMPYVLADRMYNIATAGTSDPRPTFEAWPYTTTDRTLYYTYMKRGDDLVNDTDIPIWPIRSDSIVAGALADVARWPGTADTPNLYFSQPRLWQSYEAEFEDKMTEIERQDEDLYVTMVQQWPYSSFTRFSPMSANWMQTHL